MPIAVVIDWFKATRISIRHFNKQFWQRPLWPRTNTEIFNEVYISACAAGTALWSVEEEMMLRPSVVSLDVAPLTTVTKHHRALARAGGGLSRRPEDWVFGAEMRSDYVRGHRYASVRAAVAASTERGNNLGSPG